MQLDDIVIDKSIEPRRLPASAGWRWIVQAFRLFGRHWTVFLLQSLLFTLIALFAMQNSIVLLVFATLTPMLLAGTSYSAAKAVEGEKPMLIDLFAGFRLAPQPLLRLGAIYFLVSLLVSGGLSLIEGALGADKVLKSLQDAVKAGSDVATLNLDVTPLAWLLMAMLVAVAAIQSLFYFAAPLVMLKGATPGEAVRLSTTAFWRNLMPLSVAGLVFMGLALLGSVALPLLLAMLPVMMLFGYTSYADIFAIPTRSE
ncbi:hypothetical protein SAMN02745857_02593 [Andreprevotia lacus DSM 23236]|jgi:uncharacterized membrane protein|uniref:Transmembrane protein n=1 Tax=Andreprevotia lacus DSM 23236 TaxID=1121001 RepID=A0A1W1XS19_9NEIS|nr:BPSS1780 family membrane protein [Andreprevotia lacus]SMC26686.1 hypothetical protein SAMN02745857_02593 [Andreprevotia lacus DSM 23236]